MIFDIHKGMIAEVDPDLGENVFQNDPILTNHRGLTELPRLHLRLRLKGKAVQSKAVEVLMSSACTPRASVTLCRRLLWRSRSGEHAASPIGVNRA